ncbi:MAG: sodium:alanine symporter family protein [Oscillospiraceae bacterium]|jgi:AGCS family alanine or glycine:cation symporter|nr:sodium:alanine symporter family protein [Oscillospiraceae bacterium]
MDEDGEDGEDGLSPFETEITVMNVPMRTSLILFGRGYRIQRRIKMIENISGFLWDGVLVLVLGTGIFMSVKIRFFQFIHFPLVLRHTFLSLFRKSSHESDGNSISQFQALSAFLAASMGTGNIIGVAAAILIGGAGAVFWMWVSAFLGMAVIYAENVLGTLFRYQSENGQWIGGAPAYISKGVNAKKIAVLFCVLCVLASFGIGNMTQINSIAEAAGESFGITPLLTGAVIAFGTGAVIIGGIKRIGAISAIIIPFITVAYIIAAIAVICINFRQIPAAFSDIFSGAFGIRAGIGGVSGVLIKKAINIGFRRGIFSNEAGLGSAGLLHSAANSKSPQIQGLWGMFEVFTDTVVCCTLTALAVLVTNAHTLSGTAAGVIIKAFESCFGSYANIFMTLSILMFAFATLIGWSYCGECCMRFVFGERGVKYYKYLFILIIPVGAVLKFGIVWDLSDIFNALMCLPNLFAVVLLHKHIGKITKSELK